MDGDGSRSGGGVGGVENTNKSAELLMWTVDSPVRSCGEEGHASEESVQKRYKEALVVGLMAILIAPPPSTTCQYLCTICTKHILQIILVGLSDYRTYSSCFVIARVLLEPKYLTRLNMAYTVKSYETRLISRENMLSA